MIIKPFVVLSLEDAEKLVKWFNDFHPWDKATIEELQNRGVLDFWSDLRCAVRDKDVESLLKWPQ